MWKRLIDVDYTDYSNKNDTNFAELIIHAINDNFESESFDSHSDKKRDVDDEQKKIEMTIDS